MSFRIKIKEDDKVLYRAKIEKLDEFERPFNELKKKFKGGFNG